MNQFRDSLKQFFFNFVQDCEQKNMKVKHLAQAWLAEEQQQKMHDFLKLEMPVHKARKPKDPNAPKRPRSAFFLFCQEKRASVKEKFPTLKITDIAKKLGELWQNTKKKEKWEQQAQEDKDRYEKEKLALIPNKETTPKRAKSAYIYFCQEQRPILMEQEPDWKFGDIGRELGRMWKDDFSDPKKRKKWIRLAEEDKKRYETEKVETPTFCEAHRCDVSVCRGYVKEPFTGKNVYFWGGTNGMKLFVQEMEQLLDKYHFGMSLIWKNTEMQKIWEKLTDKEKKEYEKRADEDEFIVRKTEEERVTTDKSAMVSFIQKTRPKIEKEHPQWTPDKIASQLKNMWTSLSKKEKDKYE